jgi:lipoprotein-releasing system ATP-binding protein
MIEILKAEHIAKSYLEAEEKLNVLSDVNLTVNQGDTVAITGESGCGKSTLLHILGTLDIPDKGNIYYNGNKINPKDKNIDKFRNENLGFIFQFHYLLEDFTAEENVALPMFIKTKNYKKSIERAQYLLKQLDISDRRKHYPNQLSGGEQQRVAVARALVNNPRIVLADEPTGNLDERHSNELMDFIIKLNVMEQQTFVIVTHNPNIAMKLKYTYKLENGILMKL